MADVEAPFPNAPSVEGPARVLLGLNMAHSGRPLDHAGTEPPW